MTEEQCCDWEISTRLLFEHNFVAISQEDQRTTFRQGHLEKGLTPIKSRIKVELFSSYEGYECAIRHFTFVFSNECPTCGGGC